MKNVVCSRLGKMLQLDNQKGKEATETLNFQKDILGTAACMKRIMMATKGGDQLTSNCTCFADSWFSGVKMAEEAIVLGVDYCGPAKTSHMVFSIYIKKIDERLAYRVISCYEEYPKSSWWQTTHGNWIQVKL